MSASRGSGRVGGAAPDGPLGVWIVGAGGGLATTMVVGARLLARGLAPSTGMITETPAFAPLGLAGISDLVFGGHEIRPVSLEESAREIHRRNGTIPLEPLDAVAEDLAAIDQDILAGTLVNCGPGVQRFADRRSRRDRRSLEETVRSISADLSAFRERHGLRSLVVVNLASTEPPLERVKEHGSMAGLRRLFAEDRRDAVRASTLYSWAALDAGCPFINFTPSDACLLPAHLKLAEKRGAPVMGNDGKTGETLVKSALAPMFKYRNLRVASWQGYNILGDRDGEVLANESHKRSKISTKDALLSSILGYPLHTHVAIDLVPSLDDMKTAWDFIHFQGFLDVKMSLQFTWQGCDAILAAPLVLDMVRLADLAGRRGESGLMTQLACFFKQPLGVKEHDLHVQFHDLMDYVASRGRSGRGRA